MQRSSEIRGLAKRWIIHELPNAVHKELAIGLPEWDGRLDCWRVALIHENSSQKLLGEIQVDCSGKISREPSPSMVLERLNIAVAQQKPVHKRKRGSRISFPPIANKVILGDCRTVLAEFMPDSIQLVFTSPPYFNAKPEYTEYIDYRSYLAVLREAFEACHNILAEGRFLVVNVSPVLVRRTSRKTASKRLPIPFDLHPLLEDIGFEFIDDIIWRKPEGAGWHIGRGRRFAADRQPLQYKPVTVTEYVLVYRKRTDRLIDWNLRNHPDQDGLARSLILGEYDKTNVWDITPSYRKDHPAIFPDELVRRVIRYYSFQGDVVLDPFAGSGTVGRVAAEMSRNFVLVEKRGDYFETMRRELANSLFVSQVDFDDLQYLWTSE
ncbi:MAG: site-specific DNA-methyltransferase [Chloroflexi bacterium]|nr:site-specific DNA-methyltransferase [Chloroflexota bacterium]